MNPAVTVLMAVHNGLPFLADAVRSALAQTHGDFEFLILDDASTDGTRDFLRTLNDSRVRVIELTENIGLTAALNRGLREARGEFIARQDADDVSHPRRLEMQLAFLRQHPRCAVAGSQAHLLDARGRSLGKKNQPLENDGLRFSLLFDNAILHAAAMLRRSAVEAAGGYDETWTVSQDYELWSRLSERHELANLPQRLVTVRSLSSGLTAQHRRPDLIRRVQAAHYSRIFDAPPDESDLDLMALFRSCVPPERLPDFRRLLEALRQRYETTRPNVTATDDFRRTLALIHERTGYNLLTRSRAAGLGEIWRALKIHPRAIFSLPWWRIGALALFGDRVRKMWERYAK